MTKLNYVIFKKLTMIILIFFLNPYTDLKYAK